MRRPSDLTGLLPRAVVAPEIIIVERLQPFIDWNHARTSSIDGDRFDGIAIDSRILDRPPDCFRQGAHVLGMALGGMVWIVLLPNEGILRHAGTEPPTLAVENRDA